MEGWWAGRLPRPGRSDKRALRRAAGKPIRYLEDLDPSAHARDRARELVEMSVLIFLNDGRCWLCREPVEHDATMDHVIPLMMGGDHTYNNVRLAHKRCNEAKADLHPDQYFDVPPVIDFDSPIP